MSQAAAQVSFDAEPIHTQRVGFSVYDGGLFHWRTRSTGMFHETVHGGRRSHRVSWPLGKLILYDDHLVIRGFPNVYVLGYENITRISRFLYFNVRIEHRCNDVPKNVLLWGWFLPSSINNALSRAGVRLRRRL